ncbi:MAG: protein-methionine-sulfoxide reductase catalytic subunit MsrP [Rhodospirillaceae bacterium]|nr:protein-methionine-sulfoxide reductase catalytic subunit MsrP [Rhodospirillaceae bacterium]
MLIKSAKASDIRASEITPVSVYLNRRRFMAALGAGVGGLALSGMNAFAAASSTFEVTPGFTVDAVQGYDKLGPQDEVTFPMPVFSYNNFSEFGPEKTDPRNYSGNFKPRPWRIAVDGLCAKPGALDIDAFLKPHGFEERTYRLRCTETWSIVVPWVGIALADVVKRFAPLGSAKFVRFETVLRPEEMPGQKTAALNWPYVEALRLDEALHPLAFLAVGMYGQPLLNQNGAPIRLVVPWKYGFKSIKSIVRITFTEDQPVTSWNLKIPKEYGFWANVNPAADHPRWSQATERRIGEFLRRPTMMFNGYEEEVAHMYAGMDLIKNF